MVKKIEGQFDASGFRFAIVAGRFNSFMGENLISGAIDTIVRHGGSEDKITVVKVPGSFEIPLVCQSLAETKKYDAIIAVGVVIRGGTLHYELVCNEASKGIAQISLAHRIPVAFGIITADTIEQAIERSGSKAGNKGVEAAMAAIEMANVLREIGK